MKIEWLVAGILFFGGLYALYYFLKTFINSTVKESIKSQFDINLETFKQEFTREIHSIDRKDKFRLAAIDKRLAAHQEAYRIALKLYWTVHDKGEANANAEKMFSEFWDNNCLYLTNEARNALWNSAKSHMDYDIFWHAWRDDPKDQEAKRFLNERFEKISTAPDLIMKAVDNEFSEIEPVSLNRKKITALGIEKEKRKKKKS